MSRRNTHQRTRSLAEFLFTFLSTNYQAEGDAPEHIFCKVLAINRANLRPDLNYEVQKKKNHRIYVRYPCFCRFYVYIYKLFHTTSTSWWRFGRKWFGDVFNCWYGKIVQLLGYYLDTHGQFLKFYARYVCEYNVKLNELHQLYIELIPQ